jgi:hypothetical protein
MAGSLVPEGQAGLALAAVGLSREVVAGSLIGVSFPMSQLDLVTSFDTSRLQPLD